MTVCLKQLTRKFQMPDGGAVYFEEKVAQAARPGWSAGNDACGHSCAGGGVGGVGGGDGDFNADSIGQTSKLKRALRFAWAIPTSLLQNTTITLHMMPHNNRLDMVLLIGRKN